MILDLIFYGIAAVITLSAVMVVSSTNPVHSVMFLVLTFFSAAMLFVLLEAEFLAAILVMVYMGAVAILFLFVVMMLNIDFVTLRKSFFSYLPMGIAVGLVVLVELIAVISQVHHTEALQAVAADVSNTMELGKILYTKYLYPFEVASLVLLVALIGAIVLTLRTRKGVRKQKISDQLARTREQAVEMKKIAPGQGA